MSNASRTNPNRAPTTHWTIDKAPMAASTTSTTIIGPDRRGRSGRSLTSVVAGADGADAREVYGSRVERRLSAVRDGLTDGPPPERTSRA
jgi:hypothetical protein